jgi:hypothetical protein
MTPKPPARDLLRAIALDPEGLLKFLDNPGATFIVTNGQNFTINATPRLIATYREAIIELQNAGYIVKKSEILYEITHTGYEFAEECSRKLVI